MNSDGAVPIDPHGAVPNVQEGAGAQGDEPDVVLYNGAVPDAHASSQGHCLFCMSPFQEGDGGISKLVCGHSYHEGCVLQWMETSNKDREEACPNNCHLSPSLRHLYGRYC